MWMTPELERIIVEGLSESKITEEAKRQGMVTMRQDAFLKAMDGFISIEEALEAVEE
jgi:type II secretory ATPase GspE/PulE/Tfp pilus assembly ATPase PilB-like protein